jgi:ribosomal protein S6
MSEETRLYEIGFLVREEAARSDVFKALAARNATVDHEGKCTHITLATPIEREKSAYFCFVHFSALPEVIVEIDKELKLNSKVLRFLLISLPPADQREPSPMRPSRRREDQPTKIEPRVTPEPLAKKKVAPVAELSNEELEKKLKEILQ